MKKIITISVWFVLVIALVVCLGFVERSERNKLCTGFDIAIGQDEENFFIQPQDIRKIIFERGDSIIGQPLSTLNVPKLENALNTHPAIQNAEVYVTINGEVKVDVQQRKPLIRVIDKYNDSFYIDNKGYLMPLSDNYTANILIVNGEFRETYNAHYMYSMNTIKADSLLDKSTLVDEFFDLAQYINADKFWKAQIAQLYVNNDNEFELIPRVGEHRIILGNTDDLDEKFKKLLIFYTQGLNPTGWWNNYSVINLKFKNQVVCTKK